ncbi:MAG: hypothetical protein QG597_4401 [Actinomycetota bacterium]|nr:hypothetical protein [Actinomycetota bacterium]
MVGPRRADAGASVGTYLALAALNRLVDPRSKRSFAGWWASTAADRFTRIRPEILDHRRAWDATHTVTTEDLAQIERRVSAAMVTQFGLDISAVALDRTNFATFIDSTNPSASLAQRGKAQQKRADLRLVGLGLVVTRNGGIPLLSHTYPGNRPDVTQFPMMLTELCSRYAALATGPDPLDQITVVFDAGQNSQDNFTDLRTRKIGYVTSLPPSDHPDLLALPGEDRTVVDPVRCPGLTALETRKTVYGKETRVILTHSQTLHVGQSRGLDQTLVKAVARLSELADRLARGKTRRARSGVTTEITSICKDSWVKRVLVWDLAGEAPADLRLTWRLDEAARIDLENQVFGKRVLVTNRETWPITDVVAAYRSQSDAEFGFRQLKDPHVVSFSPMNQDRPSDPGPHLHLRPGPATGAPDAPTGHPGGPAPVRTGTVGHPGRYPGNRPVLPLHRRAPHGPPGPDPDRPRTGHPDRHLRPPTVGTQELGHTPRPLRNPR